MPQYFSEKTWVDLVTSKFRQLFFYANLISFFSWSVAQFSFMRYLAISKDGKVEKWFIIPGFDKLRDGLFYFLFFFACQ